MPHDRNADLSSPLNARSLGLEQAAQSQAAKDLAEAIAAKLEPFEDRKHKRGQGSHQKHLQAIVAVFGGLLLTAASDIARWSYRSLRREGFTEEHVAYRRFMAVFNAARDADLVEVLPGFLDRHHIGWAPGEKSQYARGWSTRFRATRELFDLAATYGITPANARMHFRHQLPKRPLVLKAASKKQGPWKVSGRRLHIKQTEETKRLEAEVKELNAFLDEVDLEGGTHRGYRRIFNCGDWESFSWDKGGRLYSLGEDAYQRLKKQERLVMTINGEPVVEIDVKASFLTILYGLRGQQIDWGNDPYEIKGIPRPAVKSWVTMTLGHTKFHQRWPREVARELRKKGIEPGGKLRAMKVGEAVISKHPILADWPDNPITGFDLMFRESEAIIQTMLELMRKHSLPSYSVHDSLIVPASAKDLATNILAKRYKEESGAEPRLSVERPAASMPSQDSESSQKSSLIWRLRRLRKRRWPHMSL